MSFLSKHLAEQTGTPDPVIGPNSPHADAPHHEAPKPSSVPVHRVIGDGQRETPYQHEHYPRLLYKDDETLKVADETEHKAALGEGWSENPPQEAPQTK